VTADCCKLDSCSARCSSEAAAVGAGAVMVAAVAAGVVVVAADACVVVVVAAAVE